MIPDTSVSGSCIGSGASGVAARELTMASGSSYSGSITAGTVHVRMHCMSLVYNYSDVGEFHVREHKQSKLHGSQMNKMQHNNEHW